MRDVQPRRVKLLLAGLTMMLLVLAPRPSAAQAPDDLPLPELERAFQNGDVGALMARAADRLEMAVLGGGMLYSRGQAIYVMDRFFREHPPQAFTIDEVAEADDTWFATGRYQARGEDRRHNVYMRLQQAGHWQLVEIRISVGSGP